MNLSEFAIACYFYGCATDYDSSYRDFLKATSHSPDLSTVEHRLALLEGLNQWGCRQFAVEYHTLASEEIGHWYEENASMLCSIDRQLIDLSENEIISIGAAYGALKGRTASYVAKGGNAIRKTVGPAGAAKILFALRPLEFFALGRSDPQRFQTGWLNQVVCCISWEGKGHGGRP